MLVKLTLTFFIGVSAILGDVLITYFEDHSITKALIDNGTHAIIGGLTWSIINMHRKFNVYSYESILEILLCTAISSLIDIDHFIAAKSLKLQDIQLLKTRPFLHCTSVLVIVCLIFIGFSLTFNDQTLNTFGWIMFAAVVSHHTRDATRRGYWFYPFGSSAPIPYWIYVFILILLPHLTIRVMNVIKPKTIRRVIDVANLHSIV